MRKRKTNFGKKFLLLVAIGSFFLLPLLKPVKAKAGLKDDATQWVFNWASSAMEDNMDKWITDISAATMQATSRFAIGFTPSEAAAATEDEIIHFTAQEGGLVPIANNLAFGLSHNPGIITLAHYRDYLVYQAKAPLIPTVKAQSSSGAEVLSPMLSIWKSMRNIAYILMAGLSMIAGIMIILRKKIDAKTSVTAMYMLPRMVISLILITFSYPIAALILDLSFALTGIVISTILGTTDLQLGVVVGKVAKTAATALLGGSVGLGLASVKVLAATAFFVIVMLFIIGVLFIALINLLTRYGRLLLMTALAPIILVWDFLPGQDKQTNGWVKGVIANALAFPGVMALLAIAVTIGISSASIDPDSATIIGRLSAGVQGLIQPILVIVVLWESIKVPKAIDKMLAGKDRFPGWYAPGFNAK